MDTSDYDQLFLPSAVTSISPLHSQQFPGTSEDSLNTLARLLKDNHKRYHLFFNEEHFHNHASHHVITLYALGAPSSSLEAAYTNQIAIQKEALTPAALITDINFTKHLGDEKFYHAYIKYFTDKLIRSNIASVIEEFVFSQKFNFDCEEGNQNLLPSQMLNRFLSGLMHPQIQIGYGVEFNIKSMVIEGLSQTAVHQAELGKCIPQSFFVHKQENSFSNVEKLSKSLDAMNLLTNHTSGRNHLFEIVGRMLSDPRLDVRESLQHLPRKEQYDTICDKYSSIINSYAKNWSVDGNDTKDVEEKLEQIFYLQAIIYGIGGWSADKPFVADFFCMHLVTSVIFLPSFLSILSPKSKSMLLKSYMIVTLIWWLARGRAKFSIAEFYDKTNLNISPPVNNPVPHKKAVNSGIIHPNPWFTIFQSMLMHTDEHYIKLQRSLAYGASLYGTRPKGYFSSSGLDGAELLDGTLFTRVAILSTTTLGWVREGEEPGSFSPEGWYAFTKAHD